MPEISGKLPEPPRKATYQDVLDASENMVAQLIDGELYLHARPVDPHVLAAAELTVRLRLRFGDVIEGDGEDNGHRYGEWAILPEPGLRLGKDVLVPDIAGWRANKYQRNWGNSFSEVVPNWVCEVLSPTTRNVDLGRKSDIYAREGVSHLWIVDPKERTLQVSELSAGKWIPISTLTNAERVSVPPFEKLSISLSRLWLDGPLWRYSGKDRAGQPSCGRSEFPFTRTGISCDGKDVACRTGDRPLRRGASNGRVNAQQHFLRDSFGAVQIRAVKQPASPLIPQHAGWGGSGRNSAIRSQQTTVG